MMSPWLKCFIILAIILLIAPFAWADSMGHNGTGLTFLFSIGIATATLVGLVVFLLWRLKRLRSGPLSSQHGSTQKLSILLILAGCLIMLVTVLAWFALDRVKEKIQAGVGDALQIVLQT
ncbi:MAG: hypothetical protein KAI93_01310, partial [Desulfobacterales bacterium]|nr:hypothetical protein [Desulfobacterales bacterium]